jgi:hypothetical protein
MSISNTTEEQIRKAQRALGVNVALTPDEQLAVANAAKGTSGGYTNTPTATSPIAGLDRVVTPTPIQETITPVQPVVTNPYTDFIKTLQKPITPEEEARRERAARAVQGVAGLGNLMSAFANLTFTGKGAPSQTLPTQSVDAMGKEMTSWKDKLKAEREKYQAAELGAKAQQWKMAQDERRYADALKQQGIENELKLGNLEISRAKLTHDMDYAKQMLDLRVKELIQNGEKSQKAFQQAMKELGLKERQLSLAENELAARKDGSYYSNYGKGTAAATPKVVNTIGGQMQVNEDAYTPEVMSQALNSLGYLTDGMSETSMRSAIGAILGNYSENPADKEANREARAMMEYLTGAGVLGNEFKPSLDLSSIINKATSVTDSIKTDW